MPATISWYTPAIYGTEENFKTLPATITHPRCRQFVNTFRMLTVCAFMTINSPLCLLYLRWRISCSFPFFYISVHSFIAFIILAFVSWSELEARQQTHLLVLPAVLPKTTWWDLKRSVNLNDKRLKPFLMRITRRMSILQRKCLVRSYISYKIQLN